MAILQKASKNLIYVQVFTQDNFEMFGVVYWCWYLNSYSYRSSSAYKMIIGTHACGYIWDNVAWLWARESSADCTTQFCSHYL